MHFLEDQEALGALEALELHNHQSCLFLVKKNETKQNKQNREKKPITNFLGKITVKPKLEVL